MLLTLRRLLIRIASQGLQPVNEISSIIAFYPHLNNLTLFLMCSILIGNNIKYPKLFYFTFKIFLFLYIV